VKDDYPEFVVAIPVNRNEPICIFTQPIGLTTLYPESVLDDEELERVL